jgi:hypothetical protein
MLFKSKAIAKLKANKKLILAKVKAKAIAKSKKKAIA